MLIHPQFDPVAVSLGPLAVRWYGLMYLAGFMAFLWLGKARARTQHRRAQVPVGVKRMRVPAMGIVPTTMPS